ncbi:MAG: hypothetical protein ACTHMD_11980 [Flavisolibacter sp.]
MKNVQTTAAAIFLRVLFPLLLAGCSKNASKDDAGTGNSHTTPADKISGVFNGTGKKLPDNVSLGTYKGCVTPPGWENNFITGPSVVTISKSSDSTVTLSLTGSPFPAYTYSDVKVEENGTRISFGFGYYETSTRLLTISRNNAISVFTGSPACLQGMPYYSGWSVLNDGNYAYTTHGRIDFSGTKQ